MRTAGQPSWQITIDHPQVLAVALYIRDVAGVSQVAPPADLPGLVPPVAPAGAARAAGHAGAEWNAWWTRALAAGQRAVLELQRPDFPAFSDAPALRRLLQEHGEAALHWSGSSKRDHADRMIRTPPPLGDLVADVERVLRRPARPFTLLIDEVPVAGQGWWPVAHGHVLVSSALLRDHRTLLETLRPEIEKVA